MAMQPAGTVPLPSAQVVGNAFVEQYYHILHLSPEMVHKFYTDSSILSRPEADGSMVSVTTQKAINEKIQSMGYTNYKVEIKTADAQDSHQAGVVVLVTGCLTGTDNVRKKFTQMFFLAPQEKGYFVLNDVFRFVEEIESSQTVTAADIPSTDALIPAPDPSLAVPAHHPAAGPEVDDVANGPEVCDPSEYEESVLEEEVADGPQSKPTENETVTASSGNPEEKKSYASIVKVAKPTAGASAVYVPTGSARATPVKANQQRTRVPETASPERLVASVPAEENAPESGNIHEEGYSIYIRNMPQNATVQQLEEIFKKFGPIKHDGIQVRSNKQASCFGFVEFESLESMQNAIKASPINIGGRQAVVEEKRTNTRVGSSSSGRGGGGLGVGGAGGGGRYPTGRGGGGWYRNEGFRGGRGSNFGGRGYGRTDYRNQSEFSSRPRGGGGGGGGRNGGVETTYQRVDQTASGRSNSQGGNKKNTTTTTTATHAPA